MASASVDDWPAVRGTIFYKMSGSGNDFVVLDGRFTDASRWPAEHVRSVCDRRTGVGADGLVILTAATADSVRMAYWNADGSPGALCGNAALCSGRLAVALELVAPGEFCLLTDAGVVQVRAAGEGDTAEIRVPDLDLPVEHTAVPPLASERWHSLGRVGVPHLVVGVSRIEEVDVISRGRLLRSHPSLGVEGANANFVASEDGSWRIRTYERGVEAETLACGTGTVAAALALVARREAQLPVTFRSRGGLELTVRGILEGTRASEVWLRGQGKLVFRGVWEDR